MLPSVSIKTLLSIKGDPLYSMLKRSYRLACRIHGCSYEECKDSTPNHIVVLNYVMNLSVCLASDSSLLPAHRDVLAGVAASVSLVLESINRFNGK